MKIPFNQYNKSWNSLGISFSLVKCNLDMFQSIFVEMTEHQPYK